MNLIKTLLEELVSLKGVNADFCLSRPYSQHPPSLHAFYDSWDKSNHVTWYFRGQTSANRLFLRAVFSIRVIAVEFVYSLKIKLEDNLIVLQNVQFDFRQVLRHYR